jgi:diacylglycerol kinase family enzyme
MRRVLVVFNPVSGLTFLRPSRSTIRAELERHGARVTWIETRPDGNGHVEEALAREFDRVIVIGGDGTVRETAEFLIKAGSKTPLAILAQGTGNMLAASLGIPLFPLRRAVKFALTAPADAIDVFRINGQRICLIGAGQGYDTLFIQGATRMMKQRIGALAYVWSFARTFVPYIPRRYAIVVDGERHQAVGKLVLALNIFSLVGIPIEKAVSAHDGWIDVFVLNPRTVWEALWTGFGFAFRRTRGAIPRLQAFRGKHVSIRQRKGRNVQVDGEIYPDKHLDIEILPGALSLVHRKPFDGPWKRA